MAEAKARSGHLTGHTRPQKLRLDFQAASPLGVRMDTTHDKTPDEIAATLVLAARFIMEDATEKIVLPPAPTRSLLVELAALIDDTAQQLAALSIAANAALRQSQQ